MVDQIINALCGAGIALVGASGYVLHIIDKKNRANDKRYDKLVTEYSQLKTKLTVQCDYNDELEADNQQLRKDFQQLADEHNELKETYAPLAALNPFEKQAVSAMTDQSTLDEWMNGPKEVN